MTRATLIAAALMLLFSGCASLVAKDSDEALRDHISNPIGFFKPDRKTPVLPMFCLVERASDGGEICYILPPHVKVNMIAGIIGKACSAESSSAI